MAEVHNDESIHYEIAAPPWPAFDVQQLATQPAARQGRDRVLRAFLDPKAPKRLPSNLHEAIPQLNEPADFVAVAQLALRKDDEAAIRHEAMTMLRKSRYPQIDELLLQVAGDASESNLMRSYAIQHLTLLLKEDPKKHRGLRPMLRWFMREADVVEVRREAFGGLLQMKDPDALAFAEDALHHDEFRPFWDMLVYWCADSKKAEALPRIRELVEDESQYVRIAAINALGRLRDAQSRTLLQSIIEAGPSREATAAELALSRIGEM